MLMATYSTEEVFATLKDMGPMIALGEDEFPTFFFQ